jgi:beta-glucosidase
MVNGTFMSEHQKLLQDVLRQEWGFDGIVISDFEGVYSTVPPVTAGVALELPGPARFRGDHLLRAVKEGKVAESQIDLLAADVVNFAAKVGSDNNTTPERDISKEETPSDLLREAATEGMVLLKNDANLLPLRPSSDLKIAVFGSPASTPIIHGGGSASMTPTYCITPLEALQRKFSNAGIKYHPGVPIFKKIPSASLDVMTAPSTGKPGVDCYWYNGWEFSTDHLIHLEILETTRTLVIDSRISGLSPEHCNRMHFILKPQSTGTHTFGLTASGKSIIRVDGRVILQHDGFTDVRVEYVMQPGDFEQRATIDMQAGKGYDIVIDTLSTTAPPPSPIFAMAPQATQVGFFENLFSCITPDVSKLATECDVAIIFTANNKEYESESFDRSSMHLSPLQNDLINTVARNAPKSIVVNQTGSPIDMCPWIDSVDAILQCWYAGQEVGNALADLLSGDCSPSGKLPVTFPRRIEDSPSYDNFPKDISETQVWYKEGVEMGYRARSPNRPLPLFPFGYGLSYTQFGYRNFHLVELESPVDVNVFVTVANVGPVPGHEVVQVYVDGVLKEFSKIYLSPGGEKEVRVSLDKYAWSEWDSSIGSWVIHGRGYEVDIRRDANTVVSSLIHMIDQYSTWRGL